MDITSYLPLRLKAMKQIKTFSDNRLDYYCAYCGGWTETRDHVPSKVLLDDPYPDNLPVVQCCKKCNNNFSLDEEYFACFIECVVSGTTELDGIKREKIRKILRYKPKLLAKIEQSRFESNSKVYFKIDEQRFINVILKLARGHVKFENSDSILEEPDSIWIKPLELMQEDELSSFLSIDHSGIVPEMGSRASQRILISDVNIIYEDWIIVQDSIYRYSVQIDLGRTIVKFIIRDYLAGEVIWDI